MVAAARDRRHVTLTVGSWWRQRSSSWRSCARRRRPRSTPSARRWGAASCTRSPTTPTPSSGGSGSSTWRQGPTREGRGSPSRGGSRAPPRSRRTPWRASPCARRASRRTCCGSSGPTTRRCLCSRATSRPGPRSAMRRWWPTSTGGAPASRSRRGTRCSRAATATPCRRRAPTSPRWSLRSATRM